MKVVASAVFGPESEVHRGSPEKEFELPGFHCIRIFDSQSTLLSITVTRQVSTAGSNYHSAS